MAVNRKYTGLGRGLNAIFDIDDAITPNTPTEGDKSEGLSTVNELNISLIDPNPDQPRTNFDSSSIEELSKSIASVGIIQPITVRESNYGRYIIISGERRFKAARMAGLETIPVYIREVNDEKLLEMALVENIQREDLNPIEISLSLNRLLTECNITQEELSSRIGKSRATISNHIRLLKLPASIQAALVDGTLSMGHAKAILSLDDDTLKEEVLKRIISDSLSVRQTEMIVKAYSEVKAEDKKAKTIAEPLTSSCKMLENRFKNIVNGKISIKRTAEGENKISLSLSDEDLEKLLNKLN